MRKLKLDLDSLVVQTFETAGDAGSRGTVKAHDSLATTYGPWNCPYYCDPSDAPCSGPTCDGFC
jgi:hypothetical protein